MGIETLNTGREEQPLSPELQELADLAGKMPTHEPQNESPSEQPNSDRLEPPHHQPHDPNDPVAQFLSVSQLGQLETENNAQYNYKHVDMLDVRRNPEEYITPECLPACKALWSKNIDTYMCANDLDGDLWIQIERYNLSPKNIEIFEQHRGENYDPGKEVHDLARIWVAGKDAEASRQLQHLTEIFQIQEVSSESYVSAEDFLHSYQYEGGEKTYDSIDESGHIVIGGTMNPDRVNSTLEDALRDKGMEGLYIPEEDRVYLAQEFLDGHQRYLESLANQSQ